MTHKKPLDPNQKLDIEAILEGLEHYHPQRKGWTWREVPPEGVDMGPFHYRNMSKPLKNSIGLPASKYFDHIDPQPSCVVTTEIASGRFEDDIRRMRMAAWHGADHIMVIRTTGQSHIDGLLEGTPEGVGGVPITRKQIRASRKACDMIEEEVGRPINFHSYVSGVAGPEVAVLFAEEGINGAHQDPQYNVLYRNVNMYRSFVDAAEAKKVMAGAGIFQIDGAHNANATAKAGWLVMPELMVQHGINCAFSTAVGMDKDLIGLSTVPPDAPPAPKLWYDLPYAVALRDFFSEYKMRAQQNTRYIEADIEEAVRTHTVDTLISMLTSADIQSTITPDEGRNVPWHYNNVRGVQTVKQTWAALDGIKELLSLNHDGPLGEMVRDLKERAVAFLEEVIETGGYFAAVEQGFFVDSGKYPDRNGDGIARDGKGGVGAGTIVERESDYYAPVCSHYGHNHLPAGVERACDPIGGCTLCQPEKIVYIDELDPEDSCNARLAETLPYRKGGKVKPEAEWAGDGTILTQFFVPLPEDVAAVYGLEMAKKLGLLDPEVVNLQVMHPAEGCFVEVKGKIGFDIELSSLKVPEKEVILPEEELREAVKKAGVRVVAATVGEDEHSVGLREILDIKHGGIEKYGVKYHYLGTSVPIGKLVDAAIETGAHAILISTIISHNDVHRAQMRKLAELCQEKGIREKIILIAGGTQVNREMAQETGLDATFGRGTKGIHVVNAIVKILKARGVV
ncbi:D-ornithine 4,5-aminomutase subunit OraE [Levilinea saccharolytica]|uniref:D-ornithine 4,5-aminomutase E subunit n=1 Tax=Levilinea saccharolytica TaxID=229921 RepID=A0A0M8JQ37_9CHLR|nr:D-ornithine 4,5-aminomutase subunit OraE [Levilinea saccharolytica]KPL91592.1 LuxR family transcriptional regulator [Levilinea saccharolytica]GAP19068.1 D-ornithine 4,5-aminomutase E subunit [Levilinea saccharolytica]